MTDCIIRFKGKDGKIKFTQGRPIEELVSGIVKEINFDQLFTPVESEDGRIELVPIGRFSLLLRANDGEVLEEFPLSITGEKNLASIAAPPANASAGDKVIEEQEHEESETHGDGSSGLERTGYERETSEGETIQVDSGASKSREDVKAPAVRRGRPRKEETKVKRRDVKPPPAPEPVKRGRGRPKKNGGVNEPYTGFRLPPGTKVVNGSGSEVVAHVPPRKKNLTEHHKPKPNRFPSRAWNGAE